MEGELLSLLCDYSNKGLIADRNYIVKFIEIVSYYSKLHENVKSVVFEPVGEKKETLASYSFDEKKIYYFYKTVEEQIDNNPYQRFIPKNEFVFYKNSIISSLLLHELEHVKQFKMILENNDLESEILRLSRKDNLLLCDQKIADEKKQEAKYIYDKYYYFSPEERLAEIRAHINMNNIIFPIKNFVPNVLKMEEILAYKNMLKGYKLNSTLISPTIYYLSLKGKSNELEKFDWYDSSLKKSIKKSKARYDLNSRLQLGLPIEEKEFNSVQKQLNKLVKHL